MDFINASKVLLPKGAVLVAIRNRKILVLTAIFLLTLLSSAYALADASASGSEDDKCPALSFATSADMIPPYVAITIDAEGNHAKQARLAKSSSSRNALRTSMNHGVPSR